jgi:hypothetical protein
MKVLLIDMGAEVCFIRNTNCGQDTATVVIAVGVGDINLALRKPATESSTYTYSIPVEVAIGTPEMVPVVVLKDKPLEIAGEIE